MKHTFYCHNCQQSFSDTGSRQEWVDPIYGAAWKLVADCPECDHSSKQLKDKLKSNSSDFSPDNSSNCSTGACPFVN